MKQASNFTPDELAILLCFADIYGDDDIEELARYLDHCRIKMQSGLTAGDAILAHYRNPIGYDMDRAALDLRTWPPVAARLLELQTEEAERRTAAESKDRADRRKRRVMNGYAQPGHPI